MMKNLTVAAAIAIGAAVSGLAADAALAEVNTRAVERTSQSAAISSRDVERLMRRLRRTPNLPDVILDLAERAYRIYRLYQLGEDVRALQEENLRLLQELAKLAARLEQGELRLKEMEVLLELHERALATLKARLENKTTGRMPE